MTDTRIALDYLADLFEKLAAGDIDPARVDWPFAAEAWRAVRGELEQLREELAHLRRDRALGPPPQPVPQWLLDQHGERLKACPFCEGAEVQLVCIGSAASALDMRYFVQCEKCGARGPITLFSQKAIGGWNYAQEIGELVYELKMKPGTGEGE